MARDKDRQVNPATAALKSQKASQIKKNKAAQTAARNEKLQKRNPNTIQKQIEELKALKEAQGGSLKGREGKVLEGLERDLRVIHKSREKDGGGGGERRGPRDEQRERRERMADGAGRGGRGGRGGADSARGRRDTNNTSRLGKRRRHDDEAPDSASEDTDPEVRSIPMPKDSPPPVPRRPRIHHPGPDDDSAQRTGPHALPAKPNLRKAAAPAQTTYASEPQVRNLQKEAVERFMPSAVAARMKQRQQFQGGEGGGGGGGNGESQRLLEPEEVDRLEREGYLDARKVADEAAKEEAFGDVAMDAQGGGVGGDGGVSLEDEEAAFERELREAELEQQGNGDVDAAAVTERHQVADEARKDAREAAMAATGENEHVLNAEGAGAAPEAAASTEGSRKAQTQMRLVEVEDVSDDEW